MVGQKLKVNQLDDTLSFFSFPEQLNEKDLPNSENLKDFPEIWKFREGMPTNLDMVWKKAGWTGSLVSSLTGNTTLKQQLH